MKISRLAVGTAAVAAVAAVGVTAGTLTARRSAPPAPSPSASPSPSPSPSASPSPSPSASASPSASPPASRRAAPAGAVARDEFVALLHDGRLVTVSAGTGRVTRTVLRSATTPTRRPDHIHSDRHGVALSPDRRTIYLTTGEYDDDCSGGVIERVDVATGRRTRIGHGGWPNVSPDGTKLVYVTWCHHGDNSVVVRDLRTGTERRYDHYGAETDPEENPTPWNLREVVWHADGRRIWVVVSWESNTELRLLDPAKDRTTRDADVVRTHHTTYGLERRGAELVHHHECCYADDEGYDLLVARTPAGTERVLVRAHSSERLGLPEVGPDGDLLYERSGRLYRARPDGTAPRDLGEATALARDW
jgi:hypothetical protein